MTDTTHPLTAKVHSSVDEFNSGGSLAAADLFSSDATFIAPGQSAIAGTYHGRKSIQEFFQKMMDLSDGNLEIEPLEVLSNDDHLVLFFQINSDVGGRKLDMIVAGFHSNNTPDGWGRATFLPADQAAWDRFFAG